MKVNSRLYKALSYTFSDEQLICKALRHRSLGKDNNERLEFLGDSLLNFIVAEALFQKFPDAREGDLSRLRATLVQGDTLAELAREFELGNHLFLGEGELKSGGFRRDSILADALEAVLGGVYLDSDFETCRRVVLTWFETRLNEITLENTDKDPKTRLQEYLQERKIPLPSYDAVETHGDAHAREFVVECRLGSLGRACQGKGSSKRVAAKIAAEKMLSLLQEELL